MNDQKGYCNYNKIVYGLTTVSERGQVVIPANIRKKMEINPGDKLMVLKRGDNAGISLIKLDKIDQLMLRIQQDEEFFENIKGGE